MKLRLLLIMLAVAFFIAVTATSVFAQDSTAPPPYAGLKNPFPWDDAAAQSAGKAMFQRTCQGCHGAVGDTIKAADFSASNFPEELEDQPDFYFWRLSEGNLEKGMPPFKSSLSEDQRWQLLVYLHSLEQASPPETPPPAVTPATPTAPEEAFTLYLLTPERAPSGQPATLTAVLRNSQEEPVIGAAIRFSVEVDFFTDGSLDIGQVTTDNDGAAVIQYTPRSAGEVEIHAFYETTEEEKTITVFGPDKAFYHPDVGINFPALGAGKFIDLEAPPANREDAAPATVFRLPTGKLFWLAPMLWIAMTVWIVYFYVVYQIFRIPDVGDMDDNRPRRVPTIGLIMVTVIGIILILMLVTSPISNP